ncbi:hypothetical protein ALC56_08834 [Trachymyrmex septentrionalis]|uniref:Reticulocyte-binding protein 2 like protein a n=1 Tax=Trachymyrmex septentrionalis TaxID=34720 RepID=A0A195F9C5_9HYME|nr:PREDICTED: uncharacterized protein LOC108750592 [Trachymyrmex septentrionalis]XP_018345625.1 PREDICTED: uncharacterized protein LOC108750592 [Trachymyrmex septentrionalis]XP_018345626.1 PREDICTED: uncharacterized protein LOC108750592 [Trachymyrmex septentrionalis]KYN37043.1 hypothetical protein ALC56_08834 [Trachymyrmex septentrionalis]
MTSWSATMSSILLLNCVLATWLFVTIGAITVSIDRSDINKTPPTRSSMIANGWRPLTNSYEETIGTNVSPSSQLEKNVQVHPVLSKFQEHMATSEKLKPLRKGKPPIQEYSPPSILGSFTVFGHAATKARGETKTPSKHVATETREYTFLIPPPKDAYRFEVNQHRKPIVRENGSYLPRQPPQAAYLTQQNVHQQPLDSVRAATYFIKGFPNNRPYVPPFAMPQALQPPRQPEKQFESLKVANSAKPYFQPPGAEAPGDFGKQKIAGNDGDIYNRYQAQSHTQILNSANTGNFYSQVNHPSNHYKPSYERDPAFLVHESHEVSYVTPPGTYSMYSFRPSLPYETLLPPSIYSPSSTPPTTTAVTRNPSKFDQTNDAARENNYNNKRPNQSTRNKQEKGRTELPNPRTTSAYYVPEHQGLTPPTWPKSKYESDINEVLPKENPPSKFSQEVVNQNQITQGSKIVYHRPQSSFDPVEVYPPTPIPDYETPESISLKHFNEQQYLLQQQLLLRDRQRLAEQDRQQKLEIERQQQAELKKQQEELNQLSQREKEEEEAARLAAESAKNQSQEIVKISSDMPYTIQLEQFEPQVTTVGNILVSQPDIYNIDQLGLQPQISQIPENQVNQNYPYQQHYQNGYQEQQVNYREPQTGTRPYRPQKPSRAPQRRKKPTSITHELSPTEPPSQPPETATPLTIYAEDVPIQTTVAPEVQTVPVVTTQRSRTRRPVAPGRRRKPTTTTQEPLTTSYQEEDFLKYNSEDVQHNQHDSARRRRIKPSQANYNEDVEKRGNVRKRPGHRTKVSHDESYDTQIVTENAHVSLNSYGQTTESAPSYDENNQFATNQPSVSYETSQPINQYYDYSSRQNEGYRENQREEHREESIVPEQVPEYLTEISRGKVEDYNADTRQQNVNIVTAIPLEELYVKTDGNYFDRATTDVTTASTTTTSTTTTTPQPATQTPQIATSTSRSHKIGRPLRYGNATRPRFSIKDYKSRMDYKNRLSQSSTTEVVPTPSSEALTRGPHNRQRTSNAKNQQTQLTGDAVRETTGRYKYVSRINYRTTTSSPAAARDHERYSEESASSTEKNNRFIPKRRPISGNVYRSRIASTTTSPTRSQISNEANIRQSSTRPENVYSSSIRRRPIVKNRLQKENSAVANSKRQEESTEMAAEETNFYSTASSTNRFVGNEIVSEKVEAASLDDHSAKFGVQEDKNQGEAVSQNEETKAAPTDAALIENDHGRISSDATEQTSRVEEPEISTTAGSESDAAQEGQPEAKEEATTKFDVQSEEELFAKASQSVADLTSSASALYDKPGMFKAVSPESRLVSSQFKINTDEPTLPIEAFFQELSKKN